MSIHQMPESLLSSWHCCWCFEGGKISGDPEVSLPWRERFKGTPTPGVPFPLQVSQGEPAHSPRPGVAGEAACLVFSRSSILLPNRHASSAHLALGWVLSSDGLITATRLPPAPTSTAVLGGSTVHRAVHPAAFQPLPDRTIASSSRTVLLLPFTPQPSTLHRCHSVAAPCQAC